MQVRLTRTLLSLSAHLFIPIPSTVALTQKEIDRLDGNIIVGNRAHGGRIQIFPASKQTWTQHDVLWDYDTRMGVDGLTMSFDWINDVKRVRHSNREYVLIAGNGPGVALMDLHTEQFVFSYKAEVPTGSLCSMESLSVHAAEMLPDGNFVVADPAGKRRGGDSVRLIHGSNDDPKILQSLPFGGAHAVVWDHKRQLLWALGGKRLRKYRYISAGLDSALIPELRYKTPQWISSGHDMMPYGEDGLIFSCAQGVGTFNIEEERFELLYGNNATTSMANNIIADPKIQKGKGVDHNRITGEIIHNTYNTNTIRSPTNIITMEMMMTRSYEPKRHMEVYKAHWFVHNKFSYGPADGSLVQTFSANIGGGATIHRPRFSDIYRRRATLKAGEVYKRNIRRHSTDLNGNSPSFEKVCGPKWLKITRDGMIQGKPKDGDAADEYQKMIIRVSNNIGLFDTAEYGFWVKPAPTPYPSLSPTSSPTLSEDTTHDGHANITTIPSSTLASTGMPINPPSSEATRLLSGLPLGSTQEYVPELQHRQLDGNLGGSVVHVCFDNRCQDDPSYRSILGLSCADHHGLLASDENCYSNWNKTGGLIRVHPFVSFEVAEDELLTMVQACPCACNMDCGVTYSPTKSLVPSAQPTVSAAPSLSLTPSNIPSVDLYPSNDPPKDPSDSYFDYSFSKDGRGPPDWGKLSGNKTHNAKYWMEFDKYIKPSLTENMCENNPISARQSPIDVRFEWAKAQCFEYHEIRSKPSRYNITNAKVEKQILPSKLRIIYPRKYEKNKLRRDIRGPSADMPKAWGKQLPVLHIDVKLPSEHYMEGKQYSAEFQINLIQNSKKKRRGAPIISVLFDIHPEEEDNGPIQEMIDEFQKVYDADMAECEDFRRKERRLNSWADTTLDSEHQVAEESKSSWLDEPDEGETRFQENLSNLHRKDQKSKGWNPFHDAILTSPWFYGYEGSLTEPPCSEFVEWRIMLKPALISTKQLNQMKNILFNHVSKTCQRTSVHSKEHGVARPLQSYNGRKVHHCMCRDFIADKDREWYEINRCLWKDRDQFGFDKDIYTLKWFHETHPHGDIEDLWEEVGAPHWQAF